jgi:hypothetical protein
MHASTNPKHDYLLEGFGATRYPDRGRINSEKGQTKKCMFFAHKCDAVIYL